MPKRKKPVRRKPATRPVAPLDRLRETWLATRRALITTEQQFERQVRGLLRNGAGSRDAARAGLLRLLFTLAPSLPDAPSVSACGRPAGAKAPRPAA